MRLYTAEGDGYLDFMAGVAVDSLGHAHPHLVAALTEQAGKLWHVSNLYRIPGQERLAERLTEASFADVVFFGNSGAEAMELAIKMARKYHFANGEAQRTRIVTFEGAFHGRTLATLAAGGQEKYLEGFGPRAEGFDQLPLGDIEAVKRAVGPETAAILIEPVQGEGGVRAVPPRFLRELRALCDEHGLLLVLDEVQTGIGRTGTLFAHEKAGIAPDIMGLAKGIGGGFPMGACLATREAAKGMTAGTHGSTFGGNPLAMAVGNAVLDVVLAPGFLDEVKRKALLLKQRLAGLLDRHPEVVTELRGDGLLLGLRCRPPVGEVIEALRRRRLLAISAGENVLRLAPPLVVADSDIDEAVSIMDAAFAELGQPRMRAAG